MCLRWKNTETVYKKDNETTEKTNSNNNDIKAIQIFKAIIENNQDEISPFLKDNLQYENNKIILQKKHLREELNIMLERITNNSAFEEGWITEMTGEIIKN